MRTLQKLRLLMIGISLSVFALDANADAGVPMLFVTFPAMLLALIPIVFVETLVLARLMKRSRISLVKSAAVANMVSTIVGIPLTWIALVLLEFLTGGGAGHGLRSPLEKFLAVTWEAPWLLPYDSQLYWMVPTASLSLLVPFFFASYFIEAPIVARYQCDVPRALVRFAVFRANVASYIGLTVFNIGWLVWSVMHAPRP